MPSTTVELQIKEVIAQLARLTVEEIDPTKKVEYYGIDSLGQLEFRELLERRFQLYVDDRTLTGFHSINEIVAYVHTGQRSQSSVFTEPSSEVANTHTKKNGGDLHQCRITPAGVLYDEIEIGMSLTCLNNLAESPLLKYLGDLRWRHLSALSGVPSKFFADDSGRRLYPSFFYVEMSFPPALPMASYGENDRLKISSVLKRFGGSMLDGLCYLLPADFPETNEPPFDGMTQAVAAGVPAVRLSNIFVEQHNGSEWLRTARPANPGFKTIPELATAPESYVTMKEVENGNSLSVPGESYVRMTDAPARIEYKLVIDRDFSSTGLVYFANYPIFLDVAEREVLAAAKLRLPEEMITRRTIVRRKSAYLNNASPHETLIIEVDPWIENPVAVGQVAHEMAPIRLFVNYRMYRKSDERLMMASTAEKMIFGTPLQEVPFFSQLLSTDVHASR